MTKFLVLKPIIKIVSSTQFHRHNQNNEKENKEVNTGIETIKIGAKGIKNNVLCHKIGAGAVRPSRDWPGTAKAVWFFPSNLFGLQNLFF